MSSAAHANQIIAQLRTAHGDSIADKWQLMIHAAIHALHIGADLNSPVIVADTQMVANGRVITALGVLDMLADALGVEAISQGAQFDSGVIAR